MNVQFPDHGRCPWCADPYAEDWSDDLCEAHAAEYDGESMASAERRDAVQHAEWVDTLG